MTPFSLCLSLFLFFSLVHSLKPFTVTDNHQLRRLSSPVLSPDKTLVAYVLRDWDPATNISTQSLGLLNLTSNATKQLTFQKGSADYSPAFSPKGDVVAFLSSRSGDTQIFTVPVNGSESGIKQLSNYSVEIDNLKWSSSGKLAFSARIYDVCAKNSDPFACTSQQDKDFAARGNSGYIYESLYVRHWDVWQDGKQPHIFFVVPVQSQGVWKLTTSPVDSMSSIDGNTPIPPNGGVEEFDISADGTKIALTVENIGLDTAWTTGWDIYVSNIQTSPPTTKCLTSSNDARAENAVFSHSGRYIAYLQMAVPGDESDRRQINLLDTQTGTLTPLAASWDRSPDVLVWTCDDQFLIADVDDDGYHNLYAVSLTGKVFQLTSDGDSTSVSCVSSVSSTHKLVYTKMSMTAPNELYSLSFTISNDQLKSVVSTQLTSYNTATLSGFYIAKPEKFYFTSTDSVQVQGWLLKPYGWVDDGTKWPVAFLIHGGPESSWADNWSYRWNPQLWVSHGYAVVMVNPRGSSGFGQNFTNAVKGQWGGVPYVDLMKGLSYATGKWAWLDAGRMCALGASYGGYMINWMLGQTGTQFNCFVTHDGMFDTYASAYDTDELWFPYYEFNGLPYENGTVYAQWNPRAYVQNWQTPTLVIHGGKDYRLSETHGISVFTALQRRGIPSQFLYFPTENHWVTNSNNSILWYNTVLAWLDRWTGNK